MVLMISISALIVAIAVGIGAMTGIRRQVLTDSIELGLVAGDDSAEAMETQMQTTLLTILNSKIEYAQSRLSYYRDQVESVSAFITHIYENPTHFGAIEVLPPNPDSNGTMVLQRALHDESVLYEDVKDEAELLGNVESIFFSVLNADKKYENVITAIYLGTERGTFISYDDLTSMGDGTEQYFNYKESEWYQLAKDAGTVVFTDAYADNYDRGMMISCAAPFYDADHTFAGVISMDIMISDLNKSIIDLGTEDGTYAVLIDQDGNVIADPHYDDSTTVFENIFTDPMPANEVADTLICGETGLVQTKSDIYYAYGPVGFAGWTFAIHVPGELIRTHADQIRSKIDEKTEQTAISIYKVIHGAIVAFIIVFIIIILCVYFSTAQFSRKLLAPLLSLGKDVNIISQGNLTHRAEIQYDDEIGDLAKAFNNMTISLDEYIRNLTAVTAEKERIGAELNVATQIQADMLPSIFPPFPDRKEFDIYASMTPAKEVGGDFYDFFLLDDDHLAMVIADVSGKGVPAALFMVIAKTLLKNQAQFSRSPKEILETVNNQLCENNKAEMFVTVWFSIMEISTGKVVAANAGHEYPAIRKADGSFELLIDKHGFVLAGMEDMRYKEYEFTIESGGTLFVYTDGVAEATNSSNELYGTDRMIAALNASPAADPKTIIQNILKSVDGFVAEAPQFDDITMLCMKRA